MKKLVIVCFSFLFLWSCSLDDDSTNYDFEFLPIESVEMPDVFNYGSVHTINYSYYKPSNCHGFHDLYYHIETNEHTVAVINFVLDRTNCEPLIDELVERSFEFKPMDYQSYVFKFWQGIDENDEDVYLIYEIPVIQ